MLMPWILQLAVFLHQHSPNMQLQAIALFLVWQHVLLSEEKAVQFLNWPTLRANLTSWSFLRVRRQYPGLCGRPCAQHTQRSHTQACKCTCINMTIDYKAGQCGASVDLKFSSNHDLASNAGFAVALALVLALRPGGVLILAPVCQSPKLFLSV